MNTESAALAISTSAKSRSVSTPVPTRFMSRALS